MTAMGAREPRVRVRGGGPLAAVRDAFRALRVKLRETLTTTTDHSEREVTRAGAEVAAIVELARAEAGDTRSLLDVLVGGDADRSQAAAVDRVSAVVREYLDAQASDIHAQKRHTDEAVAGLTDILRSARAIEGLTTAARLLAFNAQLEAARLGDAGRGLAVVAKELVGLARSIDEANILVSTVADTLSTVLPAANRTASRVQQRAQDFAGTIQTELAAVDAAGHRVAEAVTRRLEVADQRLERIQAACNTSLEALQFEDADSQDLLAIDQHLHDFELTLNSDGAAVDPPLQVRLGGETKVSQSSGEVVLF